MPKLRSDLSWPNPGGFKVWFNLESSNMLQVKYWKPRHWHRLYMNFKSIYSYTQKYLNHNSGRALKCFSTFPFLRKSKKKCTLYCEYLSLGFVFGGHFGSVGLSTSLEISHSFLQFKSRQFFGLTLKRFSHFLKICHPLIIWKLLIQYLNQV